MEYTRHPIGLFPHGMAPTPVVFEAITTAKPQWEYHVVSLDPREEPPLDDTRLNALGHDGWLLAGLFATPRGDRLLYYFVRPA